jgi:hypothetical protein
MCIGFHSKNVNNVTCNIHSGLDSTFVYRCDNGFLFGLMNVAMSVLKHNEANNVTFDDNCHKIWHLLRMTAE